MFDLQDTIHPITISSLVPIRLTRSRRCGETCVFSRIW